MPVEDETGAVEEADDVTSSETTLVIPQPTVSSIFSSVSSSSCRLECSCISGFLSSTPSHKVTLVTGGMVLQMLLSLPLLGVSFIALAVVVVLVVVVAFAAFTWAIFSGI